MELHTELLVAALVAIALVLWPFALYPLLKYRQETSRAHLDRHTDSLLADLETNRRGVLERLIRSIRQ